MKLYLTFKSVAPGLTAILMLAGLVIAIVFGLMPEYLVRITGLTASAFLVIIGLSPLSKKEGIGTLKIIGMAALCAFGTLGILLIVFLNWLM